MKACSLDLLPITSFTQVEDFANQTITFGHLQNQMHSVLSRLFLGGAAPPYCAKIPPYQCFRGCCTPHKNDGMQS